MILGTPITAALSRRGADPRIMIAFGLLVFSLSLWMMTPITSQWTGAEIFWPQMIRGFSIMFCVVPATNMALSSVPPARLKMASALFNTMRNLGGAIGIACVNTWLNSRTNLHWLRICEHLQLARSEVGAWLGEVTARLQNLAPDPDLVSHRAISTLAHIARRESVTMAFSDVLRLMSLLFFAALLLVPLIRRPVRPSPAAAMDAH
jgi:DHA2 family multidrug resistance protein